MIYYVISAMPTAGKEEAATKWVLKLAKYRNDTYARFGHVEIARNLDGEGRMHWVARFSSLAAYEELQRAWRADEKAKEIGDEGQGLFAPGENHFYEIVEG